MGIFGQSSPFDAEVEKATSESNTNEDWTLILDICDKIISNPRNAKDYLKAILKRIGHNDPHVSVQAVTLLDACVENCDKPFHLEIASRDFETEFQRLLSKVVHKISLKMRKVLKKWAENHFRDDPELKLIPSFYKKLQSQGIEFNNLDDEVEKSSSKAAPPKDPNVVTSQQEEDDIAKAIELSLKEAKSSPRHQPNANTSGSGANYPSLYPSFSGGASGSSANTSPANTNSQQQQQQQPEPRKVRALYDFEAAEENELTFFSGEIIHVLDDTDPNWWKGYNQRGEGLFPSNFVTADLSVDPKRLEINQQQQQNKNDNESSETQQKTDDDAGSITINQRIEIDEAKIHRLLHLLHEANPEDPTQDSEEMLRLEQEVHQMGPLIDTELERVDRKHAQLTQLSSDLVDAINLYHSLMRDDRAAALGGNPLSGSTYISAGMLSGMHMPNSLSFQGAMPNHQMLYGAAGFSGAATSISNGGNNFTQQLPPQQQPQTYGMTSLPYVGNTGLTRLPATIGTATHNSPMPNSHIPMQFQNGHVSSSQLNVLNGNGMPATAMQNPQQPPQTTTSGYQMLPQQQFQQTSMPSTSLPIATIATNELQQHQQQSTAPTPLIQQQQQQFMSPQHLQQQPQQQQQQQPQQLPYMPQQHFTPISNGQHPQMMYTMQTTTTANPATGMLQQLPPQILAQHAAAVNANQLDQYTQMQQQMTTMPLGVVGGGMAVNQPITQNFVNQNDSKHNIPT